MSEHDIDPVDFKYLVENSEGEREIAQYLKEYPWILYWTFCSLSGHERYVFKEFPLGTNYRADFVILNSYSGAWKAHFIELESVSDKIFTKGGTPTQCFAKANRQIDQWKQFVSTELHQVRQEFCKWTASRDILHYSDPSPNPANNSLDYLLDPNTVILTNYHVIIGRSSQLSKEQRGIKGAYSNHHASDIVTYDRLLALVEKRYPLSKYNLPED